MGIAFTSVEIPFFPYIPTKLLLKGRHSMVLKENPFGFLWGENTHGELRRGYMAV